MVRLAGIILFASTATLLIGGTVPTVDEASRPAPVAPSEPAAQVAPVAAVTDPPKPEPPPPPTVDQVLRKGVLIVVSKKSQRLYVFKDGEPWGSSPVSTGRRGYATPSGVFPILQKKVDHRSNLYGGARMPYMQRLTWSGVALHAGHVPGYPASHGCIRLPGKFARSLYKLTGFSSTVVLVANERLASPQAAYRLASGGSPLLGPEQRLADATLGPPDAGPADGPVETIQLAASASADAAAAYWQQLLSQQPRLAALDEVIIPAMVNGRQVYRLRASAPAAHALCGALQANGIACLKV